MTSVQEAARAAYTAGLCILPVSEDGMKRPAVPSWTAYQQTRPTKDECRAWWGPRSGVGVVAGAISGNLEVLDFDTRDVYDTFRSLAHDAGLDDVISRIETGYVEDTPRGGVHWLYRCKTIAGSSKLAKRPTRPEERQDPDDHWKTLIETKAEGGYCILAPSNGNVHPSGRSYMLRSGAFATIATITPEERVELHRLARTLDETPEAPPRAKSDPTAPRGARPGDAFNARTTWPDLLESAGWRAVYTRGECTTWRRPGKTQGISATTNVHGSDLFYPFTTSSEFEAERSYDKFGAYAVLQHGGDYAAAARALAAQGYGEPKHEPAASTTSDQGIEQPEHTPPAWPDPPDEAAFRGIAGAYVRAIEPYTEADPAAILLQLVVAFGNAIGARPHFRVEADTHHLNEFMVTVGPTAGGRKGMALGRARAPLVMVDPDWAARRIQSGLSSGEGLLHAVRDATERPRPQPSRRSSEENDSATMLDPGVSDKRLLAVETEFASTLRVMGRDGNTLSALIRQAWDSGHLRVLTRHNPLTATGAHVSIIGHVTRDELLTELTRTDAANGFGNRFLWVCARRSRELPDGAVGDPAILSQFSRGFETAFDRGRQTGELQRTPEARALWHGVYHELSAGRPGLLGAMLSRAEAHTMRLACLYALLDGAPAVDRDHLESALALWRYCEASARYIFGDTLGNPTADAILHALRQSPEGLTRTDISSVLGRNARQAEVDHALRLLADQSLAVMTRETDKPGRPVERWRASR
jgi:hypothetical protein